MSYVAEPDTPQWFKRFLLQVNGAPVAPLNLKGFSSTALPKASQTPGALIWVTDTKVPAFSDGTYWYPITLGTHY